MPPIYLQWSKSNSTCGKHSFYLGLFLIRSHSGSRDLRRTDPWFKIVVRTTITHSVRSARIRPGEHPDCIQVALDDLLIHGVLSHRPPAGIRRVVRAFPLRRPSAVTGSFSSSLPDDRIRDTLHSSSSRFVDSASKEVWLRAENIPLFVRQFSMAYQEMSRVASTYTLLLYTIKSSHFSVSEYHRSPLLHQPSSYSKRNHLPLPLVVQRVATDIRTSTSLSLHLCYNQSKRLDTEMSIVLGRRAQPGILHYRYSPLYLDLEYSSNSCTSPETQTPRQQKKLPNRYPDYRSQRLPGYPYTPLRCISPQNRDQPLLLLPLDPTPSI